MCGAGLLTGRTDCRQRYWHLAAPQESCTLGAEPAAQPSVRRLVEGTEVLVEGAKPGPRQAREETARLAAEVRGRWYSFQEAATTSLQP